MKIAISGFVGTGKNATAEKVKRLLAADGINAEIIAPTFKDIARAKGIGLMEFQRMAEKDRNIDRLFDRHTLKMAEKAKDAIVSSWLAIWLIKDADLKVFLYAPVGETARRIAKRDKMTLKAAKSHVLARLASNKKRYKSIYGIDITDYSVADVCINTSRYDASGVARNIVSALRNREKK
jgi:cytidylate kinase